MAADLAIDRSGGNAGRPRDTVDSVHLRTTEESHMSAMDPEDVIGLQQDTEIDPEGADPREPASEVSEDQAQEIDPEAPAPL